ncbi:meiotic nuclear division protein 1 homolog isoform X3 [Bubalus bubalis]|uniref:meiotic nuclear division protein 1 homolog isoform X3 n=1 Tax=Bubalus bubalis TaxID=89462 RepID=UPI001E1B73AB|nr:meiotic nuclear division protein 1 homolog isoform X3 [Bubalus bubalis]
MTSKARAQDFLEKKKGGITSSTEDGKDGSSCESLSAGLWSADGRDQAGPAPRIGPAHPHRPLDAAARGRCAPQERGLVFLPLLLAAPPAGQCRRQNQTRPSRPRPSPRAGPAAGRRAARAMKDVFQLKDMEKIAPKEKGITAMSVKEVLQSLVDDGMVDCERIGTSNYYWAFPSKALHARKRKLEVLDSQLSEGNQKYANLQKSIEKAKVGRHETEERTMLAKELSSLRDQREQLKAEVEKYRECDPQVVEEIRQANQVAKEAANRWTGTLASRASHPQASGHLGGPAAAVEEPTSPRASLHRPPQQPLRSGRSPLLPARKGF